MDGAQFKLAVSAARLVDSTPDAAIHMHGRWVLGQQSPQDVIKRAAAFDLEGVATKIECPLLIVQGELDLFGAEAAQQLYDHTREAGVDVTLKWFTAEETGAQHCQVDNPTLGMEYICDWLSEQLGLSA